MNPKGNGDTNASALRIDWLVDSRRNFTDRSMKLEEIMGRMMGIQPARVDLGGRNIGQFAGA